jgi:hypothetical protein
MSATFGDRPPRTVRLRQRAGQPPRPFGIVEQGPGERAVCGDHQHEEHEHRADADCPGPLVVGLLIIRVAVVQLEAVVVLVELVVAHQVAALPCGTPRRRRRGRQPRLGGGGFIRGVEQELFFRYILGARSRRLPLVIVIE